MSYLLLHYNIGSVHNVFIEDTIDLLWWLGSALHLCDFTFVGEHACSSILSVHLDHNLPNDLNDNTGIQAMTTDFIHIAKYGTFATILL